MSLNDRLSSSNASGEFREGAADREREMSSLIVDLVDGSVVVVYLRSAINNKWQHLPELILLLLSRSSCECDLCFDLRQNMQSEQIEWLPGGRIIFLASRLGRFNRRDRVHQTQPSGHADKLTRALSLLSSWKKEAVPIIIGKFVSSILRALEGLLGGERWLRR